jgi:hypothetical protein
MEGLMRGGETEKSTCFEHFQVVHALPSGGRCTFEGG